MNIKMAFLNSHKKKPLYIYNTPWFSHFEIKYANRLKESRRQDKFPLLNENDFKKIRSIVEKAYPNSLHLIDRLNSEQEVVLYCSALNLSQIFFLITEKWFLIITSHYNCYEIIEFDAIDGRCEDIFFVADYILNNFKHKHFIADCKDTTSYPLLISLEKLGYIKIENDYAREKKGDLMHYVKFRIVRH